MEAVTNKTYDAAVTDAIFTPLDMSRTSVVKSADSSIGIIPVGDSGWSDDLGPDTA